MKMKVWRIDIHRPGTVGTYPVLDAMADLQRFFQEVVPAVKDVWISSGPIFVKEDQKLEVSYDGGKVKIFLNDEFVSEKKGKIDFSSTTILCIEMDNEHYFIFNEKEKPV